jgi:hypothetical protein
VRKRRATALVDVSSVTTLQEAEWVVRDLNFLEPKKWYGSAV